MVLDPPHYPGSIDLTLQNLTISLFRIPEKSTFFKFSEIFLEKKGNFGGKLSWPFSVNLLKGSLEKISSSPFVKLDFWHSVDDH